MYLTLDLYEVFPTTRVCTSAPIVVLKKGGVEEVVPPLLWEGLIVS